MLNLIKQYWDIPFVIIFLIVLAIRWNDPFTAIILFLIAMVARWYAGVVRRKWDKLDKSDREAWKARQRQK